MPYRTQHALLWSLEPYSLRISFCCIQSDDWEIHWWAWLTLAASCDCKPFPPYSGCGPSTVSMFLGRWPIQATYPQAGTCLLVGRSGNCSCGSPMWLALRSQGLQSQCMATGEWDWALVTAIDRTGVITRRQLKPQH